MNNIKELSGKKTTHGSRLRNGVVRSCGCLVKVRKSKHGFIKGSFKEKKLPRFYRIWKGIKQRCLDKNYDAYRRYGGAGITISDNWLNFIGFRDDMLKSYNEHVEKYGEELTSIGLIDRNFGYSKENCIWQTNKERINRSEKCHTEKSILINELVKKTGLTYSVISGRFNIGWTEDEILKNAKTKKYKFIEFIDTYKHNIGRLTGREREIIEFKYGLVDGVIKNPKEVLEKFGVSRQRINQIEKKCFIIISD